MAKATKANLELRKSHKTREVGVVLTLTQREAEALAAVTGKIGGSPSNSPRGYLSRIGVALTAVGFNYDVNEAFLDAVSSAMHFDDLPSYASGQMPKNNEYDEVVVV